MSDAFSRLSAALGERYRLEREVGQGGMATVYLAEDLKHHRPVALKVLRPELAAVLGSERFLREIELAARLTHPHILPVHDSGAAEGFLFYVMPYVEGESLRDRLERERQLPLDDALQIAREVADALSYAHAHGVIHRDIKPENILLESGHAVVADFGIARAVDHAGGERLTETGVAVGTPAYMSPEQAAGGRDLDGRSDLYSLGCVLYEMLAGQPPFTGPTAESVVHQHLAAAPPSITGIRPAVPAWVAAALQRALAKTPADRFVTAGEFTTVLGAHLAGGERASEAAVGAHPPAAAARWTRGAGRAALLGIAALAVVVGAVAVVRGSRTREAPSAAPRTAIAVLPLQYLGADSAHAYFAGGLHDELLTQLSKVAALSLRPRTSVMRYAGTTTPVRQIGESLAVGTVVEGSVQVVGGRLRVNVQLIDARSEEHLWAEHYDRTLDDAFTVQSDIARRIVAAVGATLTGEEAGAIAAAPTPNAEAYRLYLQSLEYRRRGYERENLEIVQQLLERALALDPGFALAHASLSALHGTMYYFAFDPRPERLRRSQAEAETALRLAPDLPQAHGALGLLYMRRGDLRRALAEFTLRAQGLPGDGASWANLGSVHLALGNWDEALAAIDRAVALDPRSAALLGDNLANTYFVLHRYADAIGAYDRALALAPDFAAAQLPRARVFALWEGRLDTLRALLARGPASYDPLGTALQWRVRIALWERKPDSVLALLRAPEQVIFESQEFYEPGLLYAAWAHRMRRDGSAAQQALRGALRQLDSALRHLAGDWRIHASRGLALAGLGRGSEAGREANWLRASPVYADHTDGPLLWEARAMVLVGVGRFDDALPEIERLLAGPSWTGAALFRLDPRWDLIRHDPRFQALLAKYATAGPMDR